MIAISHGVATASTNIGTTVVPIANVVRTELVIKGTSFTNDVQHAPKGGRTGLRQVKNIQMVDHMKPGVREVSEGVKLDA